MKTQNGNVFLSVWFLVFMLAAGLSIRQFNHAALVDELSWCTSRVEGQELAEVQLMVLESCVRSLFSRFVGQPEQALLMNWFMDVRQSDPKNADRTVRELRQISSGHGKEQWAGELLFLSLPWACLAYVLSFALKAVHFGLRNRRSHNHPVLQQRILVIEDDTAFAKLFTIALGNRGFAVDVAESLDEASQLMQAGRYDCVFCDFYLKNELGIEFYRRHKPLLTQGRFVVMSGEDQSAKVSKDRGQYKFLQKPFAYSQVQSLIPHARTFP